MGPPSDARKVGDGRGWKSVSLGGWWPRRAEQPVLGEPSTSQRTDHSFLAIAGTLLSARSLGPSQRTRGRVWGPELMTRDFARPSQPTRGLGESPPPHS